MTVIKTNISEILDGLVSLHKFSAQKTLFDYQKQALESAVKALTSYLSDKDRVYEFYKAQNDGKDVYLRVSGTAERILLEADFQVKDGRLCLKEIVNRASIWMATGSGKTLVIVKLIEVLKALMNKGLIPKADILFLTSRDDLIDQFLRHLEEFNQSRGEKIYAHNLKEYETVKTNRGLFTNKDGIDVFYYRSDLLSDEDKEKILDYRKFPTSWYLILDEAHKGDKTDSKRQAIFTALSKDGFMFNFSATFTDQIDHITCAYSFNLREFISKGYGKRICLLKYDTRALTNNQFSTEEKQKVLLKTLMLLTLVKKARKKMDFYHQPMMLVLGNSVNTEDSDLELFFRELSKVALGKVSKEAFNSALEELKSDLSNFKYAFEKEEATLIVDSLLVKDILLEVFNAEGFGKIEVIKIPNNTQELLFKHAVSSSPFMLLKIGDISEWLSKKLEEYDIVQKFDTQSVFKSLNDPENSSINILLGSRAFYEGWDSNRPNVILYLNIGTQDAKKFVLQSMGRGVRVEVKGERRRLPWVDAETYNKNKQYVDYLETLFVLGTRIDDIQKIIDTLKTQDDEAENISHLFEVNEIAKQKPLLVPIYENVKFGDVKNKKFEISEHDFNLLRLYCEYLGPKILFVKHDIPVNVLKLLFESLDEKKKDKFYDFRGEEIKDIEIVLNRVVNWFTSNTFYEFKGFEDTTKNEKIVHFKHVRVKKDKLDNVRRIVERAKALRHSPDFVYDPQLRLKVYQIHTHYYLPLVISDDERVEFVTHIIKTWSERVFIEHLSNHIQKESNFFSQFDWWMFSKIDETLDEVFIPYIRNGRTQKFKPDFIFWCAKGDEYYIIFIDPKSTEYTDALRKIDGYREIFMENGRAKSFVYQDKIIRVFLFMYGNADEAVQGYKSFWISSLDDINTRFSFVIEKKNHTTCES